MKLLLTLAITAAGLAGRSAIDKVLAARGGAAWVAAWAQLASVVELVGGVALAGIGTGLAVYVARTRSPQRRAELLVESLRLGLGVALPVALVVALAAAMAGPRLLGLDASPALLAFSALVGWLAVIPGLLNSYWTGQELRARMLALASGSAAIAVIAAAAAPAGAVLWFLAASQALPACVLALVRRPPAPGRFRAAGHPLRRYALPGLAIGIFSPASMLVARTIVGDALSWHDAGVLQALWRIGDWVSGFCAGVLAVYFLPRFAALREAPLLVQELRRATFMVVAPAAAAFALLFFLYKPLLALLYAADFKASASAVALVFAGTLVRIASWVPLYALYAMRRTAAIAVGELLSLPLFALLLFISGRALTLETAGALWLLSYVLYCAFNFLAVRASAQ